MWRVTFLWRMWRSRTRKYFFWLVTFFVTSFPKNVTFWPRRYITLLNWKKCYYSAGTETWFCLLVSDLSLISEAWSGKAIWAKTDPMCQGVCQGVCVCVCVSETHILNMLLNMCIHVHMYKMYCCVCIYICTYKNMMFLYMCESMIYV